MLPPRRLATMKRATARFENSTPYRFTSITARNRSVGMLSIVYGWADSSAGGHVLEDGIEDLARLLGIAVGEQLHRALEVGEEDGDLLALALERRARGEDLLGEVLGSIGIGSREPGS